LIASYVLQKAESIVGEKNRALKAALNAELRKEKAALHQEVTELYPLIKKKGLSQDELEEREARFQEVQEAVANIDDGTGNNGVRKPTRELSMGRSSSLRMGYSGNGTLSGSLSYEGAYEHTDETLKFVKDASVARERQDAQLENIERGVDTLKEIGAAMGEELERHDVVIDEVGEKMEVVTKELQTNNMKLKGVLNQVRSSRKIFIDIILICILLAVGLYIYSMFD
jgi:hypothetical protein